MEVNLCEREEVIFVFGPLVSLTRSVLVGTSCLRLPLFFGWLNEVVSEHFCNGFVKFDLSMF